MTALEQQLTTAFAEVVRAVRAGAAAADRASRDLAAAGEQQAVQVEALQQQVEQLAEQMTRLAADYRTLAATLRGRWN